MHSRIWIVKKYFTREGSFRAIILYLFLFLFHFIILLTFFWMSFITHNMKYLFDFKYQVSRKSMASHPWFITYGYLDLSDPGNKNQQLNYDVSLENSLYIKNCWSWNLLLTSLSLKQFRSWMDYVCHLNSRGTVKI